MSVVFIHYCYDCGDKLDVERVCSQEPETGNLTGIDLTYGLVCPECTEERRTKGQAKRPERIELTREDLDARRKTRGIELPRRAPAPDGGSNRTHSLYGSRGRPMYRGRRDAERL